MLVPHYVDTDKVHLKRCSFYCCSAIRSVWKIAMPLLTQPGEKQNKTYKGEKCFAAGDCLCFFKSIARSSLIELEWSPYVYMQSLDLENLETTKEVFSILVKKMPDQLRK